MLSKVTFRLDLQKLEVTMWLNNTGTGAEDDKKSSQAYVLFNTPTVQDFNNLVGNGLLNTENIQQVAKGGKGKGKGKGDGKGKGKGGKAAEEAGILARGKAAGKGAKGGRGGRGA
jgi:hypothetical protein